MLTVSEMQCLGEMTTWLPLPGAIGQLSARFVDESLGFAVVCTYQASPRSSPSILLGTIKKSNEHQRTTFALTNEGFGN